MIKLIIFDLDGVLIDAKEIHYEALNKALNEEGWKTISREEHLSKYDGLSTNQKLTLYNPGLNDETREKINKLKQKFTLSEISSNIRPNHTHLYTLSKLKTNYKIAVASNSVRDTVKYALHYSELWKWVDFYLSNEDVKFPKPNTEIYLQAMIKAGVSPKETLIIEDSYNGRLGAEQTGALVMGVNSPVDVTYENIINFIESQGKNIKPSKWKDPKLNILIPMAGRGSRFEQAGYTFPKPLIEVHGKPMIQVVVENLNIDANYIYLVQKEHYDKYNLKTLLNLITPNCKIVQVDGITEGAACTTLLAKEYINNDNPLLIANSDQFIDWDSGQFMYSMAGDIIDGGILTFKATHPKWSFVKINESGFVEEVAEKNPISDNATVGVYYWKKGKNYVDSVYSMMNDESNKVNNEYYIAPTFNELIEGGFKIKTFNIDKMWGLGTPEDLKYFLENY